MPASEVVTIPDTGNVRLGAQLELGAGNFWTESVDGGPEVLRAGLWILDRKVSETRTHRRVRTGDALTEGSYRIDVLEVAKGPQGAFLRVRVQPAG
jgi:hypothetical protein